MLTIAVGSLAVQDPSWGGVNTLPVPVGPRGKAQRVRYRSACEGRLDMPSEGAGGLSLSLLGLVEIRVTKRTA